MGVAEDLPGYGANLDKYPFKDDVDWFLGCQDPRALFLAQPTYVVSEFAVYAIALITLMHAFVIGGRWKYLWLATLLHGVASELTALSGPDLEVGWHSQSAVMLLGRRLPLHVILSYPALMYVCAYVVAHMKLPKWAQPLAAGLLQVLLVVPQALVALKFLHLTVHSAHPHMVEKTYSVPWTLYFFHLTFGTSFYFFLNFWRRRITGSDDETAASSSFLKETVCAVLSGLCGVPGGVVQMALIYLPLRNAAGLPSENCFLLLASFLLLVVWEADRSPSKGEARRQKGEKSHWSVWLPVLCLITHLGLYLGMALIGDPQNEVSIGMHQPTGACNHYSEVKNLFGAPLKKQTFVCPKKLPQGSAFDFHCLKKAPPNGVSWYTICGTGFESRTETCAMLGGVGLAAFFVCYNLLFRSAPTLLSKKKQWGDSKKFKKH